MCGSVLLAVPHCGGKLISHIIKPSGGGALCWQNINTSCLFSPHYSPVSAEAEDTNCCQSGLNNVLGLLRGGQASQGNPLITLLGS